MFVGWHLLVLALLTVVPVLVIALIVVVAVRARRASRAGSEERIAQRTAELLRSQRDDQRHDPLVGPTPARTASTKSSRRIRRSTPSRGG